MKQIARAKRCLCTSRSTATEITQRIKSCCEPNTEELHGNFSIYYIYISEHRYASILLLKLPTVGQKSPPTP